MQLGGAFNLKISIVIRSYNEDEHIEKLLLGIGAQRLQPDEIVLVDSGSTDQTVEIARRYGCKIVAIDKREFTFGRALNRGCGVATGDILVFPSAHVYPRYDNWLETLVGPFSSERVVLSYGRQIGNKTTKFSEHQIFAKWFPDESVCPQKSYFCNNANCAIRRSKWETLPYDETLTGLEDLAWAKKAQGQGGWIAYCADAVIVHVHDEEWEEIQNRYRREAIAMRSIDEHFHFSRLDFLKLLQRNILNDMKAAHRQGVLRDNFRGILNFRYNQLLGSYRGYNDPTEVSAELKKRFYYPKRHGHSPVAADHLAAHTIDYDALAVSARARESRSQGVEECDRSEKLASSEK